MAIALDAVLHDNAGPSTSVDTEVASAAGAVIIAALSAYDDTKTVTGMTDDGPGLTWQVDVQRKSTNDGGRHSALCSAYSPSAFPSGTTLTPTLSGGGSFAFPGAILVVSFTGVESGASRVHDTDFADDFNADWAIPSLTVPGASLFIATSAAAFSGTPVAHAADTNYAEVSPEVAAVAAGEPQAWVYRLHNANDAPGGVWSGAGGFILQCAVGAAYKEGVAAPAGQQLRPDADTDAAGWTTAPLFSKVNDESDGTFISDELV